MKQSDTIPELKIELLKDGLIRLEQSSLYEDPYCVDIHKVHVRHLAEKLGLVETNDLTAAKTVAMLMRRILLLRDRIERLDGLLSSVQCYPPRPNSDSTEKIYSGALLDLANEFCADLDSADSPSGEPQ